ncbi:VacJ family lipoprotein [Rhodobacteraceae bacterium]|nr:VacJ family lipoprotein [Paracoccaceae bacterium]
MIHHPSFSRVCALPIAIFIGLSACSPTPQGGGISDPYESANRVSHSVNKGVDTAVLRPVSQAYGTVLPNGVRRSLSNFASNLDEPRSMVNHIVQGDLEDAAHTFFRFAVNSTIGVLGLFDPATGDFGLAERETGFGDTLAVWGVRQGAYLELPLFGPSSERAALGLVVDIVTNPLSSITNDSTEASVATFAPPVLNTRYELSDTIDALLYESEDSYAQSRLFYSENRRFQLDGQNSAESTFDPYDEIFGEVEGDR